MKQFIIMVGFAILCFSCNKKAKLEYVDRLKYSDVYYDKDKSYLTTKILLDRITEESYVALKKYKGKYYFYIPCDLMGYSQIDVSKDTVKIDIGEGSVMRIDSEEHENGVTKYKLRNEFTSSLLELKKIDSTSGVYVGRFYWDVSKLSSYYLFVKGFEIEKYPVIVNACTTEKFSSLDLEFDEEDLSIYFN